MKLRKASLHRRDPTRRVRRELGEAGVTTEYAASDDAEALASLCKRVKVNVDVTEKFSCGTHP